MTDVRPFPKTDTSSEELIKALLLCPNCNVEMCLVGIEAESDVRDLYTFECSACDVLEVRGIRVNQSVELRIIYRAATDFSGDRSLACHVADMSRGAIGSR